MKKKRLRNILLTAVIAGASLRATCEPASTNSLASAPETASSATNQPPEDVPSEADKAWKELVKAFQPPMPPGEWQTKPPTPEEFEAFRIKRAGLAADALNLAREFQQRFPDHPKAAEAKKRAENLRFAILQESVQHALRVKTRADLAGKLPEAERSARDMIKEFPERREGYEILFFIASQTEDANKGKEIIKDILASKAPDEMKEKARGMEWKMDALGKEIQLAFTAVDGREVDIARLRGKVVLVDFWATWCGPCVGEMPNVKMAYEKLHDKGFEVVGISLDTDKEMLQKFLDAKEIKWPQFFEGKNWDNRFARQFGIDAIPAMWLLDKQGKLRDMNARGGLDDKVEKLLAE